MTPSQYNICVKQYADGVYRFIMKNLRNSDEAQNIVQNTFEKLWVKREEVNFEKAKSYIFTIAYRNMIDVIRASKRISNIEDYHENVMSASITEYSGIKTAIEKIVNKLPEKQKSVLMLRDYEGYDYKAISEITGMTEAQVKINIFRARQFIKEKIGSINTLL
ncbi:MAG: sigma-70 family RNA polymerase sigma factor [Bacteroidetes bacterium]|nr:sigma-70 family RNA polymerase sigma factor [Bacteroidota bacterium]